MDTDLASLPRSNDFDDHFGNIEEVFFKVADLKDNCLLINQQSNGFKAGCGIAFVKLIPLSEGEVRKFLEDRNDRSHKTMAATYDGCSSFCSRSPRTVEEILRDVEYFRDTDFGTVIVHSWGGDKVSYPSQYGYMYEAKSDVSPWVGHRYFIEAIQELARKRINPLKVLIDGYHSIGMKVHVGIRPAGWTFYEPFVDHDESPFYTHNPQWRCFDRDGTPVTRMSWAVPEVRKHLIDLLGEMAGFGADGAHIVFNRGLPVVLYEKPFVDMFMTKYHEDPRKLDESDPRILKLRADVVTTFFKELREKLNKEELSRNDRKHLEISAMVLTTEEDNLEYGIDVERIITEGLLDEVYGFHTGFGDKEIMGQIAKGLLDQVNAYSGEYALQHVTYDYDYFKRVCSVKGVPFWTSIHNSDSISRNQGLIIDNYKGGARGISVWDAGLLAYPSDLWRWFTISRLGHIEETKLRLKQDPPKRVYKYFHRLGDQIRDSRYGPYWGG